MNQILNGIASFASNEPERIAISDEDRLISFADLARQTDDLAQAMMSHAFEHDEVIAYFGKSLVERALFCTATMKAQMLSTVITARLPPSSVAPLIEALSVKLVVIDQDAQEAARLAPLLGCRVVSIHDMHPPKERLPFPPNDPEALALISTTSGSTGVPKSVALARSVIETNAIIQMRQVQAVTGDVLPLFGEIWIAEMLGALGIGVRLDVYDFAERGAAQLPDWMRRRKVTIVQTYHAVWRALAEACKEPLPDLRAVSLCGEQTRESDLEHFNRLCSPGSWFVNMYGMTECYCIAFHNFMQGEWQAGDPIPVGGAFIENKLRLVDPDGNEVAVGEVGELEVCTMSLPQEGYYRDPVRSQGKFDVSPEGIPTLRTGDLFSFDEQGRLFGEGRADDQIKLRGYAVRMSEVDKVVLQHDAVLNAACAAIRSPTGVRQMACHYILEEGVELEEAELRAYLTRELPAYMMPSYYMAHDAFPRTPTGKILRRALPDPILLKAAMVNRIKDFDLSKTESKVAEAWMPTLGHGDFGPEEEFADAGGTSLQAMNLVLKLEEVFGVQIPFERLAMDGSSVRQMAVMIEELQASTEYEALTELRRARTKGASETIYFSPMIGGGFSSYVALLNALSDGITAMGLRPQGMNDGVEPAANLAALATYAAEQIIAHDPHGPHTVLGYSFGGLAAYETARALINRGYSETRLVMFDPHTPWNRLPSLRVEMVTKRLQRGQFVDALKQTRLLLTGTGKPHTLLAANEYASVIHRPEPLLIKHVLSISATNNKKLPRDRQVWERLLPGEVRRIKRETNHKGLMESPHIESSAREINTWLKAVARAADVGAVQPGTAQSARKRA